MVDNNFFNSEQHQRMNEYLERQNKLLAPYLETQQRIVSIYNSEGYQAALKASEIWNNQSINPITLDLNSMVSDLSHNINSIKFALPALETIENLPDYSDLLNRVEYTLSNYENNETLQRLLSEEVPVQTYDKFKNVITNGYSHVKAEIADTVRKNKPEDRPTWAILLVIIMREISKALIPIAITTTLATSWNAETNTTNDITNKTTINNYTTVNHVSNKATNVNVDYNEQTNLTLEEQQQMIECLNDFLDTIYKK